MADETIDSGATPNQDVPADVSTATGSEEQPSASSDASQEGGITTETAEEKDVVAFRAGVQALTGDGDAEVAPNTVASPAEATGTSPEAQGSSPAPAAPPASNEPDAEIESEIGSLRLKGRAAERFRGLASDLKTKDARIAELESFENSDKQLKEWNTFLQESTITPQQLGAMIDVGKALNGTDLKAKGAAFEALTGVLQQLGNELGREVPGLVDPLATHADLQQAVATGQITQQYAHEVARQRAQVAHMDRVQQLDAQSMQLDNARSTAVEQMRVLGGELRKSDPLFEQKMQMLGPTLEIIQSSLHPSQWAEAAARAYGQLPNLAPAQPIAPAGNATRAAPPVGHMPLRPTGTTAGMRVQPKDDTEAFRLGAYGTTDR